MTILQLQYAKAIAKHGNFTTAAESCFVTQPTLSMQIQKLEDELGVQVFDRTSHPIKPTKIGDFILSQADTILHEMGKIKEIINQQKGVIEGDFKLGVLPTIMPSLLPLFIVPFKNAYPKVRLHIQEIETFPMIEKLKNGELDAGIATTPLEDKEIVEKPIYKEPFVAYVPEYHRLNDHKSITQNELDIEDILLLEKSHCFTNNVLNLCNVTQKKGSVNIDSGNFDTLIQLANEGLGMTLLPFLYAQTLSEERKHNLREFSGIQPSREISLIFSQKQIKLQTIDALIKTINSAIVQYIFLEDAKVLSPLVK